MVVSATVESWPRRPATCVARPDRERRSGIAQELATQWRRHSGIHPRECKVEIGRHYALGRVGGLRPGPPPGALRPDQLQALDAGYQSVGVEVGLSMARALSRFAGRPVTGVGTTYCPIVDELVVVWDLAPAAGAGGPSAPGG